MRPFTLLLLAAAASAQVKVFDPIHFCLKVGDGETKSDVLPIPALDLDLLDNPELVVSFSPNGKSDDLRVSRHFYFHQVDEVSKTVQRGVSINAGPQNWDAPEIEGVVSQGINDLPKHPGYAGLRAGDALNDCDAVQLWYYGDTIENQKFAMIDCVDGYTQSFVGPFGGPDGQIIYSNGDAFPPAILNAVQVTTDGANPVGIGKINQFLTAANLPQNVVDHFKVFPNTVIQAQSAAWTGTEFLIQLNAWQSEKQIAEGCSLWSFSQDLSTAVKVKGGTCSSDGTFDNDTMPKNLVAQWSYKGVLLMWSDQGAWTYTLKTQTLRRLLTHAPGIYVGSGGRTCYTETNGRIDMTHVAHITTGDGYVYQMTYVRPGGAIGVWEWYPYLRDAEGEHQEL